MVKFMDQFGDVIYNNYNATEAGMIATATPQDLRAAPDTAGMPARRHRDPHSSTRIFTRCLPAKSAPSTVRNSTQFDGYTSGKTKDFTKGSCRPAISAASMRPGGSSWSAAMTR